MATRRWIGAGMLLTLLVASIARAGEESSSDPTLGPGEDPPGTPQPSFAPPLTPIEIEPEPEEAAEPDTPEDRPYWRQNLFGRFFRDQKFLFTTWWPSEFRRSTFTFPLVGGIAFAATSSMNGGEGADLEFKRYVQSESRGGTESLARDFSFIGNAGAGAVLIGAGYLFGRWSHHDRFAEASSLSAEALLSAGLYSSALKALTGRPRPSGGSRGQFFDYNPGPGQHGSSFPSGHATGAFTVATVFAHVYRDHPWVSWVAYGTAGLVGASRVALNRHFPSDVIVGGLLGNSIGRMVVARDEDSERPTTSLRPYFNAGGDEVGVVWTHRW